jgi:hypothetical protein
MFEEKYNNFELKFDCQNHEFKKEDFSMKTSEKGGQK